MKIKGRSFFKNPSEAAEFLEHWALKVQQLNHVEYSKRTVQTSLGATTVWSINAGRTDLKPIVFFPGARTCAMFWDIDNALAPLREDFRLFIVDVNGQPVLSDGHSPDIHSDGYGIWASEVLRELKIENAVVAGASLGGLICLKLCLFAPHLVEKAVLFNPAGIQTFSLSFKNLYFNILPIIKKDKRSVIRFLDNAIFTASHNVPQVFRDLIIDYQVYVLNNFTFKGDLPSKMSSADLKRVKTDVHFILGDKDILFPYKKTVRAALKHIPSVKGIHVLSDAAHGIELSKKAIDVFQKICMNSNPQEGHPAGKDGKNH